MKNELQAFVRIVLKCFCVALILATIQARPTRTEAQSGQDSFVPSEYGLGPYIADPDVVLALDCPLAEETRTDDECTGALNFASLMREQLLSTAASRLLALRVPPGMNAFTLPQTSEIVETIKSDLTEIRLNARISTPQMSLDFLQDPGSRVQLVGVINRMDRQFLSGQRESNCGEISAIYRFSYWIRDGNQESRLPVTMNIVFPAAGGDLDCKTAAKRWLNAIENMADGRSPAEIAEDLMDPSSGPLAHLRGGNINRLELNMQAYRIPASIDITDFGTEASYLIRVFRWSGLTGYFVPVELPNQIDRNALLCAPSDSAELCEKKNALRARFVAFLKEPETVARIDKGVFDIPAYLGVLSERAVSKSPGGSRRSANQPYWNANDPEQQIISDETIEAAIDGAKKAGIKLSFIDSAADFRTRLNDSTCTGCHQTRAIAGFHFPGSDRSGTPRVNSILLAGSPHFYGDQPRRMEIVRTIAAGDNGGLPVEKLVTSYSARPMARYERALQATQLIGGWGGACLMPDATPQSKRKWTCRPGLRCEQVFRSKNDPGMGTCVPDGRREIGDALQRGTVNSLAFGYDRYRRTFPISDPANPKDTRIPTSALPDNPPPHNSYYGAHQEWYAGKKWSDQEVCKTDPPVWPDCYDIRRDQATGGFPAGMLRLSECMNLPDEATCGLLASSGFNNCIGKIQSNPEYNTGICFGDFTSFAAVRACDYANPCRDDYICIKPMEYTSTTYEDRLQRLRSPDSYFEKVNRRKYDIREYGQKRPDDDWVARNDQRGMCIPPYFVFQFRSDGHPGPDPLKGMRLLNPYE